MKIFGVLLILGALVVGGIVLTSVVPAWMHNKETAAEMQAKTDEAIAAVDAAKGSAGADNDRHVQELMSRVENEGGMLPYVREAIEDRRDEALTYGGTALAGLLLGVFFVTRGKRAAAVPA